MSSTRWTDADLMAHQARMAKKPVLNGSPEQTANFMAELAKVTSAKPSKYKNVKTEALGILFDSKREAAEYLRLHAREHCGEIQNLRRQVSYPLMCPSPGGVNSVVAHYIADFVYERNGQTHVVDAKGHRTREYALKAKWLALQSGIVIEEV